MDAVMEPDCWCCCGVLEVREGSERKKPVVLEREIGLGRWVLSGDVASENMMERSGFSSLAIFVFGTGFDENFGMDCCRMVGGRFSDSIAVSFRDVGVRVVP